MTIRYTPLVCEVRSILDREFLNALNWFELNSMAANPAKFQIIFLGTRGKIPHFSIHEINIPTTNCVKLLGINNDCSLNFKRRNL